jgi:putative PIN family toxin of toxin-antitoxin system
MKAKERVVIDTNALLSRLLLPGSIPGQAVRKAIAAAHPLASDDTLMELADVLGRPKFDPYITVEERREFLQLFNRIAERILITHVVRACRDPKDDKFRVADPRDEVPGVIRRSSGGSARAFGRLARGVQGPPLQPKDCCLEHGLDPVLLRVIGDRREAHRLPRLLLQHVAGEVVPRGHVWMAPGLHGFFRVSATKTNCGHVSGLVARREAAGPDGFRGSRSDQARGVALPHDP